MMFSCHFTPVSGEVDAVSLDRSAAMANPLARSFGAVLDGWAAFDEE